jgi:hypothetical protein
MVTPRKIDRSNVNRDSKRLFWRLSNIAPERLQPVSDAALTLCCNLLFITEGFLMISDEDLAVMFYRKIFC